MSPDCEAARLRTLIAEFSRKRILVIGDLMLDEFIWGKVSRISPEAPVPVVNVTGESYYPGGAANVARNLREFTPHVAVMGLAGADAEGQRLLDLLHELGIDISGVERDAGRRTTVKTRIIARNQQVARVDREGTGAISAGQCERAMRHLDGAVGAIDGIIVADYGKGFVTQPFADHICQLAAGEGKVLAIDPHPYTSISWRGATVIKPNRAEAFLAAGLPPSEPVLPVADDRPLLDAAMCLLRRWDAAHLLITLGEHGMLLLNAQSPPLHLPTRAKEVFDVSGAGDTAVATLTLAFCAGATPCEAAELANRASGVAVGKLGTATVTPAELIAALERA